MKAWFFKILMISLCMLPTAFSYGQEQEQFTVNEGETIAETLSDSVIYLYPQFVPGYVIFNNGKQMDVIMNYNKVLGKIQFIRDSKDTLAVTNPRNVKVFIAGTDRFVFDQVYYRILVATPRLMLACSQYMKVLEGKKEVGYMSKPSIDGYDFSTAVDNSGIHKLRVTREMVFSINTDYFFGTETHQFIAAKERNLIKLFPGHADKIKRFIKENKLNLKKVPDLEQVTEFVSSLPE